MGLQLVEHRDVGRGNALDRLRQQISAQLVGDDLADQQPVLIALDRSRIDQGAIGAAA